MKTKNENLLKRIEIVQRIVKDNYEPGNQRKCKSQVYKKYVKNSILIAERTFWRYLTTNMD